MNYSKFNILIMTLWLATAGCFNQVLAQQGKNVQKFTREVETNGVKSVSLVVNQSAGVLRMTGGAGKLLEGQFAFTKGEWKPVIAFTQETSKLVVKQPENDRTINMDKGDRNEWVIKLNNKVAMDIELSVGAGQSTIDLQGMKLTNLALKAGAGEFNVKLNNTSLPKLTVNAGVGEMNIDLTGKWTNNLTADISGGIGEVHLKLPKYTGVRVKISGLGNIDADGFKKEDGYYVNDAYNKSTYQLTINVSGGLGSVHLEMDK
jgi:hypothetical protein